MRGSNRKNHVRRGFPRRSASANVNVTIHKTGPANAGPTVAALTLDLSEAGSRLLVTVPLEAGEEVVLGLDGPTRQIPLTRLGHVVWSFQVTNRCFAVGVRFNENLGAEDIQQVTIPPQRNDF
jgi:hypothetical protein